MFADVIREAETRYEIYFLLTAYVEAVRFSDKLNLLPESMKALPLSGTGNVRTRFEQLVVELDAASKRLDNHTCEVIKEALPIFGAALNRLEALDGRKPWPFMEKLREQGSGNRPQGIPPVPGNWPQPSVHHG